MTKLPKINLPKPGSHKGENGRLLIIAGSKKYHGSLLYAVKAASRIVDLIYVLSTGENLKLLAELKSATATFIPIRHPELDSGSRTGFRLKGRNDRIIDCILIGPGVGVSKKTYNLVHQVLKSRIKCVLDADALNVMDERLKKLLHPNCILTPHRGEFERLFGSRTDFMVMKSLPQKYNCTILLKSPDADVIASPGHKLTLNYTGNQGMTKGGTGDVLAGLVAGLFCKNDAFTSAYVGAYVNGEAGDELYKKVGPFYDAEDLVEQIPKTLWRLLSPALSPYKGRGRKGEE